MSPSPELEPETTVPEAIEENRGFIDILKSHIGKVVTIVNPESYEDAPLGHQIRAGWYRAKPIGTGHDYLIVCTEYVHAAQTSTREPVKQYIPFSRIKRLSVLRRELLIHI